MNRVTLTKEFREKFGLRLADALTVAEMVIEKVAEIKYVNEREEKLRELRVRRDVQIAEFQREANQAVKDNDMIMAKQYLLLIEQAEEDYRLAYEKEMD